MTEFMEPLGLTAYRVAKEIGVTAPRVHEIVQGKRAISADTALRLGVFFGLPAQFWLNLQNDYDLRRAGTDALGKIRPFKAADRGPGIRPGYGNTGQAEVSDSRSALACSRLRKVPSTLNS